MIDAGARAGAGAGSGAEAGSSEDAAVVSAGRVVDGGMNTYSGKDARLISPASDARDRGISGFHVWCHVTSREQIMFPVSASSISK